MKIAIVILVLALLTSLASGFYFLMTDQGDKTKRRTFNSLGARVGIAMTLAVLIVYSVASGQLGNRNSWDAGPKPMTSQEP